MTGKMSKSGPLVTTVFSSLPSLVPPEWTCRKAHRPNRGLRRRRRRSRGPQNPMVTNKPTARKDSTARGRGAEPGRGQRLHDQREPGRGQRLHARSEGEGRSPVGVKDSTVRGRGAEPGRGQRLGTLRARRGRTNGPGGFPTAVS
ncbi:hypothetical protein NHX12_004459 [Muraenolepis orangiensis]|uniref:Uncharacterized protein n=1 Tax=Muraenolepis orangiensis TaxID=630683 RepID=A0A9Q0DUH3_9TELE|nr:hypothetical protein NHX12_004459 [Muraenolepis orangiensis]